MCVTIFSLMCQHVVAKKSIDIKLLATYVIIRQTAEIMWPIFFINISKYCLPLRLFFFSLAFKENRLYCIINPCTAIKKNCCKRLRLEKRRRKKLNIPFSFIVAAFASDVFIYSTLFIFFALWY